MQLGPFFYTNKFIVRFDSVLCKHDMSISWREMGKFYLAIDGSVFCYDIAKSYDIVNI